MLVQFTTEIHQELVSLVDSCGNNDAGSNQSGTLSGESSGINNELKEWLCTAQCKENPKMLNNIVFRLLQLNFDEINSTNSSLEPSNGASGGGNLPLGQSGSSSAEIMLPSSGSSSDRVPTCTKDAELMASQRAHYIGILEKVLAMCSKYCPYEVI